MKALKGIPAEAYNNCIRNWIKRWNAYVLKQKKHSLKPILKICIKIRKNIFFFGSPGQIWYLIYQNLLKMYTKFNRVLYLKNSYALSQRSLIMLLVRFKTLTNLQYDLMLSSRIHKFSADEAWTHILLGFHINVPQQQWVTQQCPKTKHVVWLGLGERVQVKSETFRCQG